MKYSKIAVGVLCVLLLLTGCKTTEELRREEAVSEGVSYLEELESLDPKIVEEQRREIEQRRLEAQREELQRQLLDGELDVWAQFKDYVILGDSRAVGFYYFDFLDKSRVLAGGGDTIAIVPEKIEEMHTLDPHYIYLCYGLNDTSIGYWNTKEEYVDAMGETLSMLQQEFPDAKLIVSSILPARDPAVERSSKWYNIPDYCAAVEAYCQENGISFANNDKISEEHADLWQDDGIHVRPEFYPYWATNLILASWEDTSLE